MKNVLTVKGSGCVAFGHPARPPRTVSLKMMTGARRTPLSNPLLRHRSDKIWRGGTRDKQATPIPARKRTTGASRAMRMSAEPSALLARYRADAVSIERNRGGARRCRPTMRFGVHVRGASSRFASKSSWQRRLSGARPSPIDRARRAREFRSVFLHRQLGRSPSSVADAARRQRHAGPHEICKWPTKCSSTRPTRRRPGWWSCAATASRNSTSSPLTASN